MSTDEAEKVFRDQLKNRTDRLGRLVALDAPKFVLVQEAILVFKAAVALDPEAGGKALGEIIAAQARFASGICGSEDCGARLEEKKYDAHLCNACVALGQLDPEKAPEN